MGAFYGNITLKGAKQANVVRLLRGRRAAVTPKLGDFTVVFDSACDEQDVDDMQAVASQLSRELRCPAFAVIVHDDDVLGYFLYQNGELADWYNSCPNYFDFGSAKQPTGPEGGNAAELAATFGAGDPQKLEAILRSCRGKRGYTFETDRHRDLARALLLPACTVGSALDSFVRGEYPDGLSAKQMVWAADAPSPEEERKRREDRRFYDGLGVENVACPCKQAGCQRGAIQNGIMCKRHHFEMIMRRECPFED